MKYTCKSVKIKALTFMQIVRDKKMSKGEHCRNCLVKLSKFFDTNQRSEKKIWRNQTDGHLIISRNNDKIVLKNWILDGVEKIKYLWNTDEVWRDMLSLFEDSIRLLKVRIDGTHFDANYKGR